MNTNLKLYPVMQDNNNGEASDVNSDRLRHPLEASKYNPGELNARFRNQHPDEVLKWGFETFGSKMTLGTGFGPSGVFLIHRMHKLGLQNPVFFLDTNLHFRETYELRDRLQDKLGIQIQRITPEYSLDEQAERFGDELWDKNPNRCCFIRKVKPLRAYLADKSAWITGIRRSQSGSRSKTEIVEYDSECDVVKLNPVAYWNGDQLWDYIRDYDLPYNPLHDEGFPSIGCVPCTQPVEHGEEERAGRWKDSGKTECGIHLPAQAGS